MAESTFPLHQYASARRSYALLIMPGLVPGIHVLADLGGA
jgi:hypothetical protein